MLLDWIRMTGVKHPTPRTGATTYAAVSKRSTGRLSAAAVPAVRASPPPADVEAASVDAVAREDNDIAGVEALLLNKAAPAFRENVALAAVPIRIPKPPRFPQLILKPQQQAVLAWFGPAVQRKMLLRVLLRYDEAVELADVTRRQRLLKQPLLRNLLLLRLLHLRRRRRRRVLIRELLLVLIVEVERDGVVVLVAERRPV